MKKRKANPPPPPPSAANAPTNGDATPTSSHHVVSACNCSKELHISSFHSQHHQVPAPTGAASTSYPTTNSLIRTHAHEAHKVLHLPQPDRTVAYLKTFYKIAALDSCVDVGDMWCMYDDAFAKSQDTHPILKFEDLMRCLLRAFKRTEDVIAEGGIHVVKGLRIRKGPYDANRYLEWKRVKDFMDFAQAGHLSAPASQFAVNLLASPLLPLPGPNASFIARLRRRAVDPRDPLGDEEPGFPGVSMKREQTYLKGGLKTMRQMYEHTTAQGTKKPTNEEWMRAADEVLGSLAPPSTGLVVT